MRETLYRKVGRRYEPVAEYDPLALDALPAGTHLVKVAPGSQTICTHVAPQHARVLACLLTHQAALARQLRERAVLKPMERTLSKREAAAWLAYANVAGDRLLLLSKPGARDIINMLRDLIVEHIDAA